MAAGFRQRQVCLGLVAVTASVLLSDHGAGPGQVGDGAVGAAPGDAPASRDVAQEHLRVRATHSARAWLARKVQFANINMSRNSGKTLLVTGCKRSVQGRHRNSAANDGSLPGATAGAPAAGLVIAIAVVMVLAVPRIRLRLPVPVASRRARSLAWRLRMRNR